MLPHPSQPLKNKSKKYLFRHYGELTIIGKEDNYYCETVNHNNAKAKYSPTLELDVLSWLIIITITIIIIIIIIIIITIIITLSVNQSTGTLAYLFIGDTVTQQK